MTTYELTLILDGELDSVGRGRILEKIKKIIDAQKVKISEEKEWGRKEFAYVINHKSAGHYFWWKISCEAESVGELSSRLRSENGLVRFLLVAEEKPKIIKARTSKSK